MGLKNLADIRMKRLIMLILALLTGVFLVGMLVMSSLNLDFSQKAMAELRQKQITDIFQANLNRINAHHQLMEQNTSSLANLGEMIYRSREMAEDDTNQALDISLEKALRKMPLAYGAEIWFNGAGTPGQRRQDTSTYAYRNAGQIRTQSKENVYHSQDWYTRVLPEVTTEGQTRERTGFFWTPAYYKELIDNVVISLTTEMRNNKGQVVGLASSDWRADDIISLVSGVKVTPSTFAFLLDNENRNLSSLAYADDVVAAQRKIDAIIDSRLHDRAGGSRPESAVISGSLLVAPMQTMPLTVDDEKHLLFFSRTRAGMIFGVGVPQAEIDAVLLPMRESNLKIVALVSAVTLGLTLLIMLIVARLLNRVQILYTDALTQLPNREKLLVDLKSSKAASLLLINIDSFKEINDFYGHHCGDHVIGQLALALQDLLTQERSWTDCRLYRMPGDELAIWLPSAESPVQLTHRAESILRFVSLLSVSWQNQTIPLNVSLGVASSLQADGSQMADEQLLASASIALKSARMAHLGHSIYDPAHRTRESYEQNLIWANRLRRALDDGRIVPYFQPIMDLRTGRIEKFECLARMIDEEGKPISPSEFLGIAKKIRLYRFITRTMVTQCFTKFADNDYAFSLNLSCEDLLDPDLTDFIVDKLRGSPSLASRLIFEILESEGIENYAEVRRFIDRVKALGCRIAIDDFGTGYSNFQHLLRLNVDIIKIDGSLIEHIDTDQIALNVTRGIQQFATGLGMRTVAEFVHSKSVLECVRLLNIDEVQGYCIGKPSPHLITEPDNDKPAHKLVLINRTGQ
jgi:diguanylate cyclase (GGDEF)-like protein